MGAFSNLLEDPSLENYQTWALTTEKYPILLPIWGQARLHAEAEKAYNDWIENGQEAFEKKAEEALDNALSQLGTLAEQIGAEVLNVIRGLIPAIIDGLKAGYEVAYADFIKQGPEVIAAGVIVLLLIVIGYTLLHEVKTGPVGAGEFAANNRFE